MQALAPRHPGRGDLPTLDPALAALLAAGTLYDARVLVLAGQEAARDAGRVRGLVGTELEASANHSCLHHAVSLSNVELRAQASTFLAHLARVLVGALPRHSFDLVLVHDPEMGTACVRAHQSGPRYWLGCNLEAQPYPTMVLRASGTRAAWPRCEHTRELEG